MVEGPVTYGFTLYDVGGCVGTTFKHFLLGSHNFMVWLLARRVSGPRYIGPFILCSSFECGVVDII